MTMVTFQWVGQNQHGESKLPPSRPPFQQPPWRRPLRCWFRASPVCPPTPSRPSLPPPSSPLLPPSRSPPPSHLPLLPHRFSRPLFLLPKEILVSPPVPVLLICLVCCCSCSSVGSCCFPELRPRRELRRCCTPVVSPRPKVSVEVCSSAPLAVEASRLVVVSLLASPEPSAFLSPLMERAATPSSQT